VSRATPWHSRPVRGRQDGVVDLPVFVIDGGDVDVFPSAAEAEGHAEVYDIGGLLFIDADGRLLRASADGYRVRLMPTDEDRLDELRSRIEGFLLHTRPPLDPALAQDPAAAAAALLRRKVRRGPGIHRQVATEAEALEIAKQECVLRGLTWRDPMVRRGWRWWRIWTPGGQRGGNAIVYVARRDGTTKVRYYDR